MFEAIGYLAIGTFFGLIFRFLKSWAESKETWIDLTDDEMLMIYGQKHEGKKYSLGRMVQQTLKEKNK
jgi:hypothetical protein